MYNLEKLVMDKHSSLLRKFVNYLRNKFYDTGHWSSVTKKKSFDDVDARSLRRKRKWLSRTDPVEPPALSELRDLYHKSFFFRNLQIHGINWMVFVPRRPFQPSLLFKGKARSLWVRPRANGLRPGAYR
jgi:hypothetical protein